MSHIDITDETFEDEVLSSPLPVLVDFWAPWCGPCRSMGPVLEELGEEFDGRVRIAKLNTEENPRVAAALRINAIPALLFFKGGQLVDGVLGLTPKAALKQRLERLL